MNLSIHDLKLDNIDWWLYLHIYFYPTCIIFLNDSRWWAYIILLFPHNFVRWVASYCKISNKIQFYATFVKLLLPPFHAFLETDIDSIPETGY